MKYCRNCAYFVPAVAGEYCFCEKTNPICISPSSEQLYYIRYGNNKVYNFDGNCNFYKNKENIHKSIIEYSFHLFINRKYGGDYFIDFENFVKKTYFKNCFFKKRKIKKFLGKIKYTEYLR